MKPNSLGFVLPGMKAEYELSNLVVSAFPTIALAGTVAGSVLWGWAADVYGRVLRASGFPLHPGRQ